MTQGLGWIDGADIIPLTPIAKMPSIVQARSQNIGDKEFLAKGVHLPLLCNPKNFFLFLVMSQKSWSPIFKLLGLGHYSSNITWAGETNSISIPIQIVK